MENADITFSVIIPVFNGADFVSRAVDSALAQTFGALEIIVVDDGSTDDTLRVLSRYADRPAVRVISQPNGGAAAARNTAMAAARGAYFAFLDADDLWDSDHLSVIAAMIRAYPDAGLCATRERALLPSGALTESSGFSERHPGVHRFEDFPAEYAADRGAKCFNSTGTVIRADAALRCGGFHVGCRIGEDLALALKVSLYYPVVLSSRPTTLYDRRRSHVTAESSFDPDWYFFEEAETLLRDPSVPQTRRDSFGRVMDWFRMRRVRHYLIDGRRADARRALHDIRSRRGLRKDLLLTELLFPLPTPLIRRLFLLRRRNLS